MKLEKRVAGLEAQSPTHLRKVHIVPQTKEYATADEALDAYGRHLIGPDDRVIMLVSMTPEREEECRRSRQGPPDEAPQP